MIRSTGRGGSKSTRKATDPIGHSSARAGDCTKPPANKPVPKKKVRYRAEEVGHDRYTIHRILEHENLHDGRNAYRVRWYGYSAEEDTWEPIHHLPRNKVLQYCRSKGLPIPEDINDADES